MPSDEMNVVCKRVSALALDSSVENMLKSDSSRVKGGVAMADGSGQEVEQPAFEGLAPRKRRKRKPRERHPAAWNPVVQVVLDIQATHLGRPFDYLIEEKDSDAARPGVMVRVRFGKQRVNGIIWARRSTSDTPESALRFIERVVTPEVLVSASMRRDITAIADAYGGTPANILRLALPPRVARVDQEQRLAVLGSGVLSEGREPSGRFGGPDDVTQIDDGDVGLGVAGRDGSDAADIPQVPYDTGLAGGVTRLLRRHIDGVMLGREFSRMQGQYDEATALRDALSSSGFSSFVFDSLPGPAQWARELAWMTVQALQTGRGAVLVLPTMREVNDMMRALGRYGLKPFTRTKATHGGFSGDVAPLCAVMAPAERYRSYLAAATGQVRCVIGTRAAMYAPLEGEALFALMEDNAYQYADGMMPYARARGVLRLRARAHGGTFVSLSNARSVLSQWESQAGAPCAEIPRAHADAALAVGAFQGKDDAKHSSRESEEGRTGAQPSLERGDEGSPIGSGAKNDVDDPAVDNGVVEIGVTGPSKAVHPLQVAVREAAPWTRWFNRDELTRLADPTIGARVPHSAVRILSEALERGPVLFSIPRDGVTSALSCAYCHRQARCPRCTGPLLQDEAGKAPRCAWCGAVCVDWTCPACRHDRLRVVRVGAAGTAEELQRLFHGVDMVISSPHQPGGVIEDIDGVVGMSKGDAPANQSGRRPLIVIATPGAEPRFTNGYQAVAILDAWTSLYSQSLDARPDVLTSWMRAVALCAPRAEGGQALILGETDPVIARSLLLWDSRVLASDELMSRRETGLPPAVTAAAVWGRRDAVEQALRRIGAVQGDIDTVICSTGPQPAVLGPVSIPQPHTMEAWELDSTLIDRVKAVVRVPQRMRAGLAGRLHDASARHVAGRETGELRFQIDPKDLD